MPPCTGRSRSPCRRRKWRVPSHDYLAIPTHDVDVRSKTGNTIALAGNVRNDQCGRCNRDEADEYQGNDPSRNCHQPRGNIAARTSDTTFVQRHSEPSLIN